MSVRRTLALIAAVLFGAITAHVIYAGIADDSTPVNDEYTDPDPTVFIADDPGGSFADAEFVRVRIDGMPCIIYKDKVGNGHGVYAYSGLSCDWSQFDDNGGYDYP